MVIIKQGLFLKRSMKNLSNTISFQLMGIILVCICVGLLYRILVLLTAVSQYCWPITQFWFDGGDLFNPYFLFTVILFLLFIWLSLEFYRQYKMKTLKALSLSIIISIFISLSIFSWIHYKFYGTLQTVSGEKYFYDIWPNAPRFYYWKNASQREHERLVKYTCTVGIDWRDLSPRERWEIIKDDRPTIHSN